MTVKYIDGFEAIASARYAVADLKDIHLDKLNPRFASSLLLPNKITEQAIVDYLVQYADVTDLAAKIANYSGLFNEFTLTAYSNEKNQLVVLEGNRRIAACKLITGLISMSKDLQETHPLPANITENLKKRLSKINLIIYDNSDDAQQYIAFKHTITDVKTWSTIEKYNYYYGQFKKGKTPMQISSRITGSNSRGIITVLKRSILFQQIFRIVQNQTPNLKVENSYILPLVASFMPAILGNGIYGLNLNCDEDTLKYIPLPHKKNIYEKILLKIGNAFLNRPSATKREERERRANSDEFLVSSDEVKQLKPYKIIEDDIRIPGLKNLIEQYKDIPLSNSPSYFDKLNKTNIESNSNKNIDALTTEKDNISSFSEQSFKIENRKENANKNNTSTQKKAQKDISFFGDLEFQHIDIQNKDNTALINICKEIKLISNYYGSTAYSTFPISSAFLLRALIEQVIIKQVKLCGIYENLKKENSAKTPALGKIIETILKHIQNGNSQLIFSDNKLLAKDFNQCFDGHGTKDQLDTIIHRPEVIKPGKTFLDDLSKQGLKHLIQSLLDTFK